jgi:hypothetical protein
VIVIGNTYRLGPGCWEDVAGTLVKVIAENGPAHYECEYLDERVRKECEAYSAPDRYNCYVSARSLLAP